MTDTLDQELEKAGWEAEHAQFLEFFKVVTSTAAASLDRARKGAELVATSAAAIGSLYTALLALSFSVTDRPLPLRGLLSAIFLALAIVLALAYMAFLRAASADLTLHQGPSNRQNQMDRTWFFVQWVGEAVYRRGIALRAAILSLAIGVAFLPLAFVATVETSGGGVATIANTVSPIAVFTSPPPTHVLELEKLRYAAQLANDQERYKAQLAQAKLSQQTSPPGEELVLFARWLVFGLVAVSVGALVTGEFSSRALNWLKSRPWTLRKSVEPPTAPGG